MFKVGSIDLHLCLQNLGIRDFGKCDFSLIATYLTEQREKKKQRTKDDKKKEKEDKKALDDHYGWCLIDGRKEKVGNYRIEPPSLFKGRGAHPKAGTLKVLFLLLFAGLMVIKRGRFYYFHLFILAPGQARTGDHQRR